MKTLLVSFLVSTFAPIAPREVAQETVSCEASRGISDDASKCKNKCNSKCSGAQNKSKCVAECRRACDK